MLIKVPKAGEMQVELWNNMQPLNISFFQSYWDTVETDTPLLDWDNAIYKEWTYNDHFSLGMRDKITELPHGVVR
jgi:hypothetical protein